MVRDGFIPAIVGKDCADQSPTLPDMVREKINCPTSVVVVLAETTDESMLANFGKDGKPHHTYPLCSPLLKF